MGGRGAEVISGLGAGYQYLRRLKSDCPTSVLVTAKLIVGPVLGRNGGVVTVSQSKVIV